MNSVTVNNNDRKPIVRKLSDVAEIRSGVHFRERIKNDPKGNVAVLQMKDISEENKIVSEGIIKIRRENIKPSLLLRHGDVLLRARGIRYTSSVFNLEIGEAIASSQLIIIKPNNEIILPSFLSWFLNQKPAQNYLKTRATGSYVKMIPREMLAKLEIVIPTIENQELISQISKLSDRESLLMKTISEMKKEMVNIALLKSVKE